MDPAFDLSITGLVNDLNISEPQWSSSDQIIKDLQNYLLYVQRAATERGYAELADFIDMELSGYSDTDAIPAWRSYRLYQVVLNMPSGCILYPAAVSLPILHSVPELLSILEDTTHARDFIHGFSFTPSTQEYLQQLLKSKLPRNLSLAVCEIYPCITCRDIESIISNIADVYMPYYTSKDA